MMREADSVAVPGAGRFSVVDRVLALRDRLLADPRFQLWASGFPLTRWVARRRASALFDLCAGFVYSQVLHACVALDVFEVLKAQPLTSAALAQRLSLSVDATERLMAAAVSLGLVARRSRHRYGLGALGAAMIGNPGVGAMVRHHAMLYRDLIDPVELLRAEEIDTNLSRYWAYARSAQPSGLEAEAVGDYSALMAISQPLVAAEILDTYSFRSHRRLLDLGGGEGAFLSAVGKRYPELALTLFDLPPVAARATARFAEAGLSSRATAVGGSFLADTLPTGADIVSLVRVIHDHDDDAALAILRAARGALPQGGRLLLAEPMSGTPGAEAMADAYFGFYLLAMGSGRPRTPERLAELVEAAGFDAPKLLPARRPMMTRVMIADATDRPIKV